MALELGDRKVSGMKINLAGGGFYAGDIDLAPYGIGNVNSTWKGKVPGKGRASIISAEWLS